jgi:hypothetical protein
MLAGEVAEILDEIKRNFPPGASPRISILMSSALFSFPVFGSVSSVWPWLSQGLVALFE